MFVFTMDKYLQQLFDSIEQKSTLINATNDIFY